MFKVRIPTIVILLLVMVGFTATANAQDTTPVTPALGQVWHYNGTTSAVSPGTEYYYDSTARVARLVSLNEANSTMQTLMSASMTFTAAKQDARQPEEEVLVNAAGESVVLKAGWQTTVTNLVVAFPACFTTDLPVAGESVSYQPDPNNPSVLYTNNATPFTGTVTAWFDCSNWGQIGQAILDAAAPTGWHGRWRTNPRSRSVE